MIRAQLGELDQPARNLVDALAVWGADITEAVIIVYMLKFSADYPKRVTAQTRTRPKRPPEQSRRPGRSRVRPNRLTPGRGCAVLYAMDRHLTPPVDDARRRAAAGARGLCSSCCCR